MICVDNQDYEASLETRKLYQVLTDKEAEKNHQVRVIDESGEDYLYPEGELPQLWNVLKGTGWKGEAFAAGCCSNGLS